MRVAVLGVGLIGGSIGLSARRRLAAEVVGFDPDPDTLAEAARLGAISEPFETASAACAGADAVFCAAPVGALPALVSEALDTSPPEAVISDVGSTKRRLVTELAADARRFVGGHPLAGSEAAGVANASAELFEGARWYLTPTEATSGLHYERLQRLLSDLGARPLAIDPDAHDRLMAHVSHLPHVLANVLVSGAAGALAEESERIPEVGPSFRDSTRVAGANPSIWADIYASNSASVAAALEEAIERLSGALELLRSGDREALSAWQAGAAEDRRRLLESRLVGGELHELRVAVPNRPGVVAAIALALGGAGVNIEDLALHPAADMRSGAISIWLAGAEAAERAAEIVAGLGHRPAVIGPAG